MKLTKISSQFEIYLSGQKDESKNPREYKIGDRIFYRFMDRLYIPDRVSKLSPAYVKELNGLREKYALFIIDEQFNDEVINIALSELKTNVNQLSSILDFGCGYGYAGEQIQIKFPATSIFGLDIRKPRDKKFLNRYTSFAVKSIDSTFPYSDDFFDAILSFFVFHFYVSDFQLTELKRVLKPGGVFFLNMIHTADLEVLNRLAKVGFKLQKRLEIVSASNSGDGYIFRKDN